MTEGKETNRVPEVEDGGERGELTAPEHEVSFFGGTKQERGKQSGQSPYYKLERGHSSDKYMQW